MESDGGGGAAPASETTATATRRRPGAARVALLLAAVAALALAASHHAVSSALHLHAPDADAHAVPHSVLHVAVSLDDLAEGGAGGKAEAVEGRRTESLAAAPSPPPPPLGAPPPPRRAGGAEGGGAWAPADRRPAVVFASFATGAMSEFTANWYEHVAALGVGNVLVAAFDAATEKACATRGIPYRAYDDLRNTFDGVVTGGTPLGNKEGAKVVTDGRAFQHLGSLKAAFLLRLLEDGQTVLVSDVDTAWMRDPRPWLADFEAAQKADVAVSNDCLSREEDEKQGGCISSQFNTGILWLRPTAPAKALMAAWRDELQRGASDAYENDQGVFNRLVRVGIRHTETPFLTRSQFGGGLNLGVLPLSLFCSGHVYFVQRLPQRLQLDAMVVHTTYQFSHSMGKRQRLREAMLWAMDPPEYYSPDDRRGFITFDPELPPELRGAGPGVAPQLQAAAWYRLAVRNVLALAQLTNRTLVMAPLKCLCDRWWGNVAPSCRIPGSSTPPPFERCPMDHVFFLPNFEKAGVIYREHSLLENPRTPEAVRNSVTEVRLPALPTDREAVAALQSADARVLRVMDPTTAFCRFEDAKAGNEFDARMNTALAADVWFCANGDPAKNSHRECDVGMDVPLPTTGADCSRLRGEAWTTRFKSTVGKHVSQ